MQHQSILDKIDVPETLMDMNLRLNIIQLMSDPSTDKERQRSNIRVAQKYLASLSKSKLLKD